MSQEFQLPFNTHDDLIKKLRDSIKEMLNVKEGRRELRVKSIQMPENERVDDMEAQKNAKIQGISYTKPVYAELELLSDNEIIDSRRVKLFDLPQVTKRGSYIVGGNEYSVPLQKRLIPGVYTREHNDGKISAWLNSSKGRNMHVTLRTGGDFVLEVDGSNINLMSVLLGLGFTTDDIRKAWGAEVFERNLKARGATNAKLGLEKLYNKLHYLGDPGVQKKEVPHLRSWILRYFDEKTEFDPENVEITLGQNFDKTSPKLILEASKKVLAVSRGDKDEDNKESLVHNDIFDLSDFVIERINQRQYQSKIKRRIKGGLRNSTKKSVRDIYTKDLLQLPVDSTFTQTNLSKLPKQNNPMDTMSAFTEITVMGEGGIQSSHAVTRDVRAIDPSHLGFVDPAHTPEGSNIGTTLHIAKGVKKKGKDLVRGVYNVKTKEKVDLNPRQFFVSYVTFPEFVKVTDSTGSKVKMTLKPGDDGLVKVMHRGEIKKVSKEKVQYALRVSTDMFGVNTLAIPFLSHNNGIRVMTASKMQTQAKPLKYREAPLVQSAVSERQDETIEQIMGKNSLPKSPVNGVVKEIRKGAIVIKDSALGKDHTVGFSHNMWMNENNFEHHELKVAVGDQVKKGQILADSNYTKNGILALGVNLRTAYMAYKGLNHEDGIVISETGAEKLTSLHAHQKTVPLQDNEIRDKKKFVAYFPAAFTSQQMQTLDNFGVVKVGTKVKKGDPLVVKMREISEDTISKKLQNISRLLVQDYRDTSVTWTKSSVGEVAEVYIRNKDIFIVIKTEEKMKLGDKTVGRFGNKGTITKILPDSEMPKDKDGNAMDIIIDPSSVPGRMNLGQIMETSAANIAEKQGKPYIAKPFGGDHTNSILKELKANNLKDHSTLFDEDGPIDGILAGKQYFFKLEHQVEKKLSARGAGAQYAYSLSGQPGRGNGKSGRAVGLGELYALLSHGADANLKEMYTFKGDRQLEAWRAIENGTFMPPPEMPASSEKFVNMLKGMGINLQENDKGVIKMVPFLDRDVKKISNGEVKDATTLRAKDLKEEKGGLFDFKTTGGLIGDKWSHIELAEPMPHPTFERSILSVLHIKKDDLQKLIKGEKGVLNGEIVDGSLPGTIHGGKAVKSLLGAIDIDARLKYIKEVGPTKKGTDLNKLNREARVLRNFKDNGIKLEEMVVSKIPVMAPKFRPIAELPNGDLSVADVNEHYRATILINNQLKELQGRPGLIDEANKLRGTLYDGFKGVTGFSMGIVEKPDVKGIASTIAGSSPKYGLYHSQLLKRRQDVSGTAVISPEPKFDMDTIGIPENMAWRIFEPFTIKELKSSGLTSMRAREEIEKRTKFARDAMIRAMSQRKVIANRAPTLHRGSIMAFNPTLTPGSSIKLPVEVLSGFSADHDGDTMGIHVPTTPEAVQEAEKMLPSNNLYASGKFRSSLTVELGKEYMMGIYKLSRNGRTTSKVFTTKEQAVQAAEAKKIKWDDIISVKDIGRTTAGKIRLNKTIPDALKDYQRVLTAKEQEKLFIAVEKAKGKEKLKEVMGDLKEAGRLHVYTSGTSFLLSDLKLLTKERKALYAEADRKAKKIRMNSRLSKKQKEERLIDIYSKVDSKIMGMSGKLAKNDAGETNNITDMVESGMSKPGPNQLKQLVGTLGLMMNHKQEVMPEPVRGNYGEGLDSSEFFAHMYAQRKGIIDRSQSVSGPGMLSKEITNSATTQKVTELDCGTQNGKMVPVDKHIVDRLLAETLPGLSRNTVLTSDDLAKIQRMKRDKVKVRSILTCESNVGVCAKCFGLDETGGFPYIGKNVGVSEIQAITERSVQLPMRNFHCYHPKTISFIKHNEKIYAMTLSRLFAEFSSESYFRDGIEMKWVPPGWEIWDADGWVPLLKVARHEPDSPMVIVKTKSGHMSVSQDNHPIMVRDVSVACKKCGNPHQKVQGTGRNNTYAVRCNACKSRTQIDKNIWKSSKVVCIEPKDFEGHEVLQISIPEFGGEGIEHIWTPWLMGFFLAEGSFGIREEKEPKRNKPIARGVVARGGLACNTICISQNPGVIQNALYEELDSLEISYSKKKKGAVIHDNLMAQRILSETASGAENKTIPSQFFTDATLSQMADLLAGWIDGDGCIVERTHANSTYIQVTSTSIALIQGFHLICGRLGLKSNTGCSTVRDLTRNQAYEIRIYPTQTQGNKWLSNSKKCKNIEWTVEKEGVFPKRFDTGLSYVKPMFGQLEYVYDVTTETGTFCANGIWTHNSGGVATAEKGLANAFDRALQILRMPDNIRGKATLATISGTVTEVRKSGYGGHIVVINGKDHKVSKDLELKVKVGTKVKKGDALSSGIIKPQELLELKGVEAVQENMVDSLHDTFASAGVRLSKRTYEVPAKMLTEQVRVLDPGDHPTFVAGDYTNLAKVEGWNRQNLTKKKIVFKHILPGSQFAPQHSEDWARRMALNRITRTLEDGVAMGFESDRKGPSPFADLVLGPGTRIKE